MIDASSASVLLILAVVCESAKLFTPSSLSSSSSSSFENATTTLTVAMHGQGGADNGSFSLLPSQNHDEHDADDHDGAISIASWNYDYVSAPFTFTGFVVLIAVLKIAYHHVKPLAKSVPESCLLIIIGILLGCLFLIEHADRTLSFLNYDNKAFFLYLLPPIILEAAYSLRDRAFVENIGTIFLFAIVGTVLNTFFVGPLLYLATIFGWVQIGFLECLIFSSLIAAVDPVAVLAIFQEVGVNKMLYFMVFGESLFNDAVTVVIYKMMVALTKIDNILPKHLFLGLLSFLCVSLGGMVIGVIFGILTCLITKHTTRIRVVEPVIFFALAYLSYLSAEMVHFSGIISIICCGLIQGYYATENISSKSYISIVYFSKVTSNVMESLIFIILGVMLVVQTNAWSKWSTAFAFWSLLLCLVSRFLVVFGISFMINAFLKGIRSVSLQEQFIMAYGGLRGAISFSLVFMLNENLIHSKNTLLTATYFIILFTVFIQGTSIKPLVRLMRIKLDVQDSTIFTEINRALIGNTLAGVEEIVGHKGTHYYTALFKHLSQTVVRPAIQKDPEKRSSNLLQIYQERTIQQQLSTSNSQADVPKLAALWNQLELLDDASTSASISDMILQAQDDYVEVLNRRKAEQAGPGTEALQGGAESIALLEKRKTKPHALSLDSPRELLQFRDLLESPAHKTMHYTFDRDLASPSKRMFVDSLAHVTRERAKSDYQRRRSVAGRSRGSGRGRRPATAGGPQRRKISAGSRTLLLNVPPPPLPIVECDDDDDDDDNVDGETSNEPAEPRSLESFSQTLRVPDDVDVRKDAASVAAVAATAAKPTFRLT